MAQEWDDDLWRSQLTWLEPKQFCPQTSSIYLWYSLVFKHATGKYPNSWIIFSCKLMPIFPASLLWYPYFWMVSHPFFAAWKSDFCRCVRGLTRPLPSLRCVGAKFWTRGPWSVGASSDIDGAWVKILNPANCRFWEYIYSTSNTKYLTVQLLRYMLAAVLNFDL
jgi:hypothetical protein